jgi:hypothetical protein
MTKYIASKVKCPSNSQLNNVLEESMADFHRGTAFCLQFRAPAGLSKGVGIFFVC